ncbi:FHA domain-containing protein [bacterium]|nr:MAG: FHA domain-containing protein [bacterium]
MSSPTSPSARLDVTQGPLQGQSVDLLAPETIVGREFIGSVPLTSYREVSRQHARFYLYGGTWCIEDLGSTNGTFVNNVRATPSFSLADGVQIQMGDFHARFRLDGVNVQPNPPQGTQTSPTWPQLPAPVAPIAPVVPQPNPYPYQPTPVIYPVEPPKQVVLAVLFSFLLVGGGQFYNGDTSKGISMLCGALFCGFAAIFTCGLTALGCTIIWIFSMVDAAQTAERINRESGWQRRY